MWLFNKSISVSGLLASIAFTGVLAFVVAGAETFPSSNVSPFMICSSSIQAEFPGEASYLADNDLAMSRMMSSMVIKPTGDVDRDFVAVMAPHHQGAIDMAVAVLRSGRNPQIRRLAQEIIVTQQQEIAAMRLAIGAPLPLASPAPTQSADPMSFER